jgi:hypothetical protein
MRVASARQGKQAQTRPISSLAAYCFRNAFLHQASRDAVVRPERRIFRCSALFSRRAVFATGGAKQLCDTGARRGFSAVVALDHVAPTDGGPSVLLHESPEFVSVLGSEHFPQSVDGEGG